jgi:hypothetical protein
MDFYGFKHHFRDLREKPLAARYRNTNRGLLTFV